DGFDLQQGEVALLVLRRPDLTGDVIAGLEVEAPDLRRRDVNVLRAGEITEAGRTQETVALGHDLEDALGEQNAPALGVLLEDREDELVLFHRPEVLDTKLLRLGVEIRDRHAVQLRDVDRLPARGLDDHTLPVAVPGRDSISRAVAR